MPCVLVVDDEESVRRALRRLFERGGMTVIEAESGAAALRLLGEQPGIEAVVSDVLMPEMNGVDFYDRLVARAPRLEGRVVFLTGAAGEPQVHRPLEARSVPLLSKLGDLTLVLDAIRLALLRAP